VSSVINRAPFTSPRLHSVMSPIAFIIGAGSNVGTALARRFVQEGYTVVIGSRKPDVEVCKKEGLVPMKIDVCDEASIVDAFAAVEKELGPANVVVYNGRSILHPVYSVLKSHLS
jgi:NAD(P)-dependent dehydrogenase (short-subunit alcohol dehydrogenase family)